MKPVPDRKFWRSRMRDQGGLTLLEVVVTLVLLGMLGVMAAEAIRLGRRSWEKHKTQADAEQRIRVTYDILAQEMASLQPVTEVVDGTRVVVFEGGPDRITFYGKPDPYQPFPYQAMIRNLSFTVDQEKGLVMHERFPLVTDEAYRSRVRIVDPTVRKIAFRYLLPMAESLRDTNWRERWVPIEFVRSLDGKAKGSAARKVDERSLPTEQGGGLPLAIEVTVTMAASQHEKQFNFVVPLVVGGDL